MSVYEDGIPDAAQAQRYSKGIQSRLGEADGLEALVDATGVMIRTFGDMAPIPRTLATAAGAYVQACLIADKAGGRKLTNDDKRKRLAGAAELLRDAADQLDRVCL